MENILSKIIEFADMAHGEQQRKYTPDRYIVHPVRVMNTCKRFTTDECILAAAILHDVLEDTSVNRHEMENFLSLMMAHDQVERTIEMVVELTDIFVKKDFPHLNRRTRKAKELERHQQTGADAQTIKYADIIDNSTEIVQHDPNFAQVILYEYRSTLMKLTKGNTNLHREALQVVEDAIKELRK